MNCLQTLSVLTSITMILVGCLWLRGYLLHSRRK